MDIPSRLNTGVVNSLGFPGDWDNGLGFFRDGPFINKADEADTSFTYRSGTVVGTDTPYFPQFPQPSPAGDTYFAPNRQVPSPAILGSLPSRLASGGIWETLLFCPNPAAGSNSTRHRGFNQPNDSYFLDLFSMPIVEPYAISEPLSTAGKINMNYQLVPFTYIIRNTAIRAALGASRVGAIQGNSWNYKSGVSGAISIRYPIHSDETLKKFQARFDDNSIFKTPGEITSIWLYPANQTNPSISLVTDTGNSTTNIQNWWYSNANSSWRASKKTLPQAVETTEARIGSLMPRTVSEKRTLQLPIGQL